jgi:hypothetical protein
MKLKLHRPTPKVLKQIADGTFTGLVRDLPPDVYHASHQYWSNSLLGEVRRSPAHARAKIGAGGQSGEKTDALIFGERVHMAVLEAARFRATYAIAPNRNAYPDALQTHEELKEKCRAIGMKVSGSRWELVDRLREVMKCTTGHGIVLWDDIVEEHTGGREVLSADEMTKIEAISASVMAHHTAAAIFTVPGHNEVSAFAVHPILKVRMRARFDRFLPKQEMIADLKTSANASPESFPKSIANYGYHRQSAFYLDVLEFATGIKTNQFPHVVVEKEPPYAVAVYLLDDGSLEKGRQEYVQALEQVMKCEEAGEWPAYSQDVIPIALPSWAFNN